MIERLNEESAAMTTESDILDKNMLIPNFKGMTLKQAVKEAKKIGLQILPLGTSGRVVWQSIAPGRIVDKFINCTIKLETI